MKKVIFLLVIFLTILSCKSQGNPTKFSQEALNDIFITLQGDSVTLKNILEAHKDKIIVIDIWASWCSDCIKGMPKVKALQEQFPDAVYMFLSLDRGQDAWKRGIEKYNVVGEHYYLPNAKDCDFANFVNISWIPRYMVINAVGEIVVFDVIEANDNKLIEALKN